MPPEIAPLLERLRPVQRAMRVERGHAPAVVATVYHLIDRGRSAEYVDAANAAGCEMSELSLRITGPAPCYAFAVLT